MLVVVYPFLVSLPAHYRLLFSRVTRLMQVIRPADSDGVRRDANIDYNSSKKTDREEASPRLKVVK